MNDISEYVNITTPERFCKIYEKCKLLSMGYIFDTG